MTDALLPGRIMRLKKNLDLLPVFLNDNAHLEITHTYNHITFAEACVLPDLGKICKILQDSHL